MVVRQASVVVCTECSARANRGNWRDVEAGEKESTRRRWRCRKRVGKGTRVQAGSPAVRPVERVRREGGEVRRRGVRASTDALEVGGDAALQPCLAARAHFSIG